MENPNPKLEIPKKIIEVNANTPLDKLPGRSSESEFINNINELRKSGSFCDVDIKVGGKTFKAHKVVLAAVSELFKEHFTTYTSNEVNLKDEVPFHIFEIALNWVYGESVTIPVERGNHTVALMALADSMKAPSLLHACGILMRELLDENNCFAFYEAGNKHEHAALRKAAMEFIRKHFHSLWQRDQFLEMSTKNLKNLMEDGFLESHPDAAAAALKYLDNRKRQENSTSTPVSNINNAPDTDDSVKMVAMVVIMNKLSSDSDDQPDEPIHVRQCLPPKDTQGFVLIGTADKNTTITGLVSIKDGKLYVLAPPPFQGSTLRLTNCGKHIYVQTMDNIAKQADLWCYRSNLNQWAIVANGGPGGTRAEGLVQIGDVLYVFGADLNHKTVWRYDPDNRTWNSLTSLSKGVHQGQQVVLNGMIYILGEDNIGSDIYTFQRYDPQSGNTEILDTFPVRCKGLLACAFQGLIFVVDGGKPNSNEPSDPDIVYEYNPSEEKWERGPPLHKTQTRPDTLVILDGCLTLVEIARPSTVNYQQYSPSTRSWTLLSKEISVEPLTTYHTLTSNSFMFRR